MGKEGTLDAVASGEELNTGAVTEPRQAATVIVLRGGSETLEVLLVRRNPEARFMGGAWVFPGGAVDPEETPADAAVREVYEETGLTVELTDLIGVFGGPDFVVEYENGDRTSYLSTVFAAVARAGTPRPDGVETLATRFVTRAELSALPQGRWMSEVVAAVFAPMMACVTGWFDTHRSLAVSLVSAGMGMAPMTMSPFAAWLVSGYDWRTALQIIAVVVAIVMIPVSLLVRQAPALAAGAAAVSPEDEAHSSMTTSQVLKSPLFIILLLTNFFCCATHSGPIFHTVSYAVTCGIPVMAAVSIYSIEGLAGMGGRVVFGLLGDRFGAKRVLVLGLLAQAFGALAYVFAAGLGSFYAVAALFGFIYAGVMPLYAVLARENFPLRMMGTVIGGTAMAGSLGMATGPIAGGMIYDALASYTWLYVGSWGIGLGAFLIALTFRPAPRYQQAVAAAA